jgi:hypothetical protein
LYVPAKVNGTSVHQPEAMGSALGLSRQERAGPTSSPREAGTGGHRLASAPAPTTTGGGVGSSDDPSAGQSRGFSLTEPTPSVRADHE